MLRTPDEPPRPQQTAELGDATGVALDMHHCRQGKTKQVRALNMAAGTANEAAAWRSFTAKRTAVQCSESLLTLMPQVSIQASLTQRLHTSYAARKVRIALIFIRSPADKPNLTSAVRDTASNWLSPHTAKFDAAQGLGLKITL